MSVEIDTSRAPRGELAATVLVQAVAAGDDLLERHYLEIKSQLNLGDKRDVAKIAKFILGAANRLPEVAATAFEGCAVMVVGVSDGKIEGISSIEMMELARMVEPYVGVLGQAPHWDRIRVPVPNCANEVLVIVVEPPQPGQDPFLCRGNGEGLRSGRIYIRADGETREPNANELDLLLQRGKAQATTEVAFDVRVVGTAYLLDVDEETTLEGYIAAEKRELIAAMPQPEPKPESESRSTSAVGLAAALGSSYRFGIEGLVSQYANNFSDIISSPAIQGLIDTEPEKRTEDDYLKSIDKWEAAFRAAWPAAVDRLAGYYFASPQFEVINKATTNLDGVEAVLHLEGAIEAVDAYEWTDDLTTRDLDLLSPPRKWGPTKRNPFYMSSMAGLAHSFPAIDPIGYHSRVSWENGGSVRLNLDIGKLRPKASDTIDEDDLVLIVRDPELPSVTGTWEITADGHHAVFDGALTVDVDQSMTLTRIFRHILGLEVIDFPARPAELP